MIQQTNDATNACSLPEAIRERLTREPVVWLGTVGPDGAPHILPLWFAWDGEAITLYSKPSAVKVRNIRRDPRVTIAVGTPGLELDVALLEGHAELQDQPISASTEAARLARYAEPMRRLGVSPDEFLGTYSQAIKVVPSRLLDWGRPGWTVRRNTASGELEPLAASRRLGRTDARKKRTCSPSRTTSRCSTSRPPRRQTASWRSMISATGVPHQREPPSVGAARKRRLRRSLPAERSHGRSETSRAAAEAIEVVLARLVLDQL